MTAIIIHLRQPECHVCGKQHSRQELEEWNGVPVCTPCKQLLYKEFEGEESGAYGKAARSGG